jgi:hypothetical protein
LIASPLPSFCSAASISFSPFSFFTSHPGTVSGSVVDPILPSRETRIGVCGSTWSTFSAWAKKALICLWARGLLAPRGSFQVT